MCELYFFSIFAVVTGIILLYTPFKNLTYKKRLSTKDILFISAGLTMLTSGTLGFFYIQLSPVNAILFGVSLFCKMKKDEKQWKGRRLTTGYSMHISGWLASVLAIFYGLLKILDG